MVNFKPSIVANHSVDKFDTTPPPPPLSQPGHGAWPILGETFRVRWGQKPNEPKQWLGEEHFVRDWYYFCFESLIIEMHHCFVFF
jgi:hypothetical protein